MKTEVNSELNNNGLDSKDKNLAYKNIQPSIQRSVNLSTYTTFRIGGVSKYFCDVNSIDELLEVLKFCKKENLKYFVLGFGSNTIFKDKVFEGVIIKLNFNYINIIKDENDYVLIKAGAGIMWDDLVKYAIGKDFYGIENLSYIPGTVGASPVQNIGAYGVEVKDCIETVFVVDYDNLEIGVLEYKNRDCGFSYRDSNFKRNKNLIIVSVTFKLSKIKKFNLSYKPLDQILNDLNIQNENKLTLNDVRDRVIQIRKSKLPEINEVGNCGSFFKNPIILKTKLREVLEKYPDIPIYDFDNENVKLSAAWILDNVVKVRDLQNKYEKVGVYEKQCLVLINKGNAEYDELYKFVKEIQKIVKENLNIVLEPEVNIISSANNEDTAIYY